MNIVIVSAFRQMAARIDRYMAQVDAFQRHIWRDSADHYVRVAATTGDNTDDTENELQIAASRYRIPLTVKRYDTHKRLWPSIEHAERLEALQGVMLANMANVIAKPRRGETFSSVSSIHLTYWDDVVLYVESDLIWEPHQVGSIIDMAYRRDQGFDIVAPMIFCGNGEQFYDIFVYRKNGVRFSPFAPYSNLKRGAHEITEVDSVGSCLAFRAELASIVKPIGKECLISWCNGARKQGYKVGVAAGFRISHPF